MLLLAIPSHPIPSTPHTQWFQSWHPTRPATYFLAAAALACVGLAHEALAAHRLRLARGARARGGGGIGGIGGFAHPLLDGGGVGGGGAGAAAGAVALPARLAHSALYTLNLATGYLLMLAVMSFNAGFFAVVLLSMGAGHFLWFSRDPWQLAVARGDACCETAAAAAHD